MIILLLHPVITLASVRINEIAWMGGPSSASDEWIELYNNGTNPVDLNGWVLTDGDTLTIELTGVLGAGACGVLERTDDNSAPGSAFLVYSGALANDGVTLTLYGSNGNVEDTVVGGEGWVNVGGDNDTKYTANRIADGWGTLTPTPGAQNTAVANTKGTPDTTENEEESTQKQEAEDHPSDTIISLELPDTELSLSLLAPEHVYVGQEAAFDVLPEGISDALVDSLVYSWNFGDARTAIGKTPTHVYTHPGDYVVVVEGNYVRHEARTRKTITVLPITVSISRAANGDVEIHNETTYEIDLSHFLIRGSNDFMFPENTFLLPEASLVISRSKVGGSPTSVVGLHDPTGNMLVIDASIRTISQSHGAEAGHSLTRGTQQYNELDTDFRDPVDAARTPQILNASSASESLSQKEHRAAAIVGGGSLSIERLSYLGLIGVLVLGTLAVYMRGSRKDTLDR